MNKFILLLLCILTSAMARAYDYDYLVIHYADGTTSTVGVASLVMIIENGELVAKNTSTNWHFTLKDLQKMYFSTASDGITDVSQSVSGSSKIDVYTYSGVSVGTFDSTKEAVEKLAKGIYIFKNQSKTSKIIVR